MFGLFRFLVNGITMLIVIQELFHPELVDSYKWHDWLFVAIVAIIFNWGKHD